VRENHRKREVTEVDREEREIDKESNRETAREYE